MSPLNMALVCIRVGLGTSHFVIFASMGLGNLLWPFICYFPRHHDLRSFDVKYYQIQFVLLICSREVFLYSCQPSSDLLLVLIHFRHVPLSRVDDVGKIMALLRLGHFLSTSAHYPGSWSRESLPVPSSLHASMEISSHSMIGPHHWPSIRWFHMCSTPDHCSHFVDCTYITLRAIVIIVGFSHAC